jgi:hypothetical protein
MEARGIEELYIKKIANVNLLTYLAKLTCSEFILVEIMHRNGLQII